MLYPYDWLYFGEQFNKACKNHKLYKFLNNDLTCDNFQYKLGPNINPLPFNHDDENAAYSRAENIHFCRDVECYADWKNYGKKLALIEIPEDAVVNVKYFARSKTYSFKTNKIEITEILDFSDVPDEFWIKLLRHDGTALEYVKKQTKEICEIAVKNGAALRYVRDQFKTEELCASAVKYNSFELKYVDEQYQSEELCMIAVSSQGSALEYVKEQYKTDKICETAVQRCHHDGETLRFVTNQTEKICTLAVWHNSYAIKYVKDEFKEKVLCEMALWAL